MNAIERRLKRLEVEERHLAMQLPPREWFARGYIRIDRLDPPEQAEFEGLLERIWDDHGYMVPERLSYEERLRATDLCAMLLERVP